MSTEDKRGYLSPRVEDTASEAGDRPPHKAPQNSQRQRPPYASGPAVSKAGTRRSASDSGYSSKTERTGTSSINGSARGEPAVAEEDTHQEDRRRPMPYHNTHMPEKEPLTAMSRNSLLGGKATKKARPKAIPTRSERGPMAPPPLPPAYHQLYTSAQHQRPLPLRVNTANAPTVLQPSPMGPPPTPNYHPLHPSSAYPSNSLSRVPSHPNSAPPSSAHGSHGGYFPTQAAPNSYQQPYQRSQQFYAPAQPPYPQSQYPVHPPAPSPGFAVPAYPQRPGPLQARQMAPVVSQAPPQHYVQYTPVSTSNNHQALTAPAPKKQDQVEGMPFIDSDNQIKCYINGVLCVKMEPPPALPPKRIKSKQREHRHRSRDDDSDSDSSSCSQCSSSSSYSDGRASPRKALRKAKTAHATRSQPDKSASTRRDSYVSARRSDEPSLYEEERAKISAVESYHRATATPPRRQSIVPRYIEDTARATKAGSPRHSLDSSSPQSPTHSRTSESRSDVRSKRDSFIISTKGKVNIRPTEDGDGYSLDAAEGQELRMMFSNGQAQRREKRYYGEDSSVSASRSRRRTSTASSNRAADFVTRLRGEGREERQTIYDDDDDDDER